MIASDNLFAASQNLLNPEIISRISSLIGESEEKTRRGLKEAVPALLMGVVDKGITLDGAERVMELSQSGVEPETLDHASVQRGQQILPSILGENQSKIAERVSSHTGMHYGTSIKLLSSALPLVLGLFGSKIRRDHLSASGFMRFIRQQRNLLGVFMPDGLNNMFANIESDVPALHRKSTWFPIVAIIGAVLLALLWLTASHYPDQKVNAFETSAVSAQPYESVDRRPSAISDLDMFLNAGTTADLPKRFLFDRLKFEAGKTVVRRESFTDLDTLARTLDRHQNVKIEIVGYTDNIGQESANQNLSFHRAVSVKEQLVARGVAADRISARGEGSANPLSSNDTKAGQSQNRRIEVVVTHL